MSKKAERSNPNERNEDYQTRLNRMYPVYDGDMSAYSYPIKCAICGEASRAQFNQTEKKHTAAGWRFLKPIEFAKPVSWVCPKHAGTDSELQAIIDAS